MYMGENMGINGIVFDKKNALQLHCGSGETNICIGQDFIEVYN